MKPSLPDQRGAAITNTHPIAAVATIILGQSPPSDTYNLLGDGVPFLQGKAEFGPQSPTASKWCSAPLKIAPSGATLISVRAPVGDANLADQDYCIGRGLAALVPGSSLDSLYLYYWLSGKRQYLASLGTGSTFQSINGNVLRDLLMPVPPLVEQQRIARILHTMQGAREPLIRLLSGAATLKGALAETLLTPLETVVSLSELVDRDRPICYGIVQPGPAVADGVPYINVVDMVDGMVRFGSLKRTSRSIDASHARSRVFTDDVLVAIRGTHDRVTMVPAALSGANISRGCARVATNGRVSARYLYHYLQSRRAQAFLASRFRGVALGQVNLAELSRLPVPIPTPQGDAMIVRALDAAETLQASLRSELQAVDLVFLRTRSRFAAGVVE